MKHLYRAVFFFFVLCAQLFAADTLEVFAIRVQFAEESPDNSLTTGTGLFDSDKEKKNNYKLDPPGMRNSIPYWKKHFDFANAYFKAASNGNLVIKSRIFPEASSAYKLKKHIIDYNRTSKMHGEKTAEFDEARSKDYLRFVYDAVVAAHESGESPFNIPLSKNSNTKRAYMIIHAGASRLVDGGGMGTRGADTPGDFMDVYVAQNAWSYLPDTLQYTAIAEDSTVNGLVLKNSAIDTLRSIMVMSETASQDGLNWGVNGIMVNQIGREIGLPDTYDVVKGISKLGYFDVMDFAGYSAGNGFLPSMPAAWERAYMGWSNVKEVRPIAGKPITVDVSAAGTGKGIEIIKVPLSASEYLLIENRQRSWNKDGLVSVTLGEPDESSDTIIKTVTVDSLNYVFEDSVCVKGKCSVNKKKASGIILDVSSLDAGIPASGIVVWRVNDWFLRETLQYGIANFWGGDTLRDHQFGISMIESDGVLSIGKTFKNAIGEDTYDYGAGSDLLPHLRVSEKQKFDTVKTIGSSGYANTMTTQGGYTGIKISVQVPKNFRSEKTANSFMGDSVLNFAAQTISVTISIDDGSIDNGKFPLNIGLNGAVRAISFVDNPENADEKILVVGSEDGTLQAFSALGDTLFMSDTSVVQHNLSNKDNVTEIPLYRLGQTNGQLIGMATDEKSVYSLHSHKLVRTDFSSGIPMQSIMNFDESGKTKAVVGPAISNSKLYFATDSLLWAVNINSDKQKFSNIALDLNSPSALALCATESNQYAVIAGKGGKLVAIQINDDESKSVFGKSIIYGAENSSETFNVACTDMARKGNINAILVGSQGTVEMFNILEQNPKAIWQKTYKRGESGTSGLKDETSGIAIGDVNGDGFPEIVFLGDNLVYALDYNGLPIAGFPIKISRGSPIYGFFSDPIIVDVTGDDIPEILVPSNDGLVYAFNGKGKAITENFPIAAGSFEYADSVQALMPMSIFVKDAVSANKSVGPELYALHRNYLSAFRLRKASNNAAIAPAAWSLPFSGDTRTNYFDASKLKEAKVEKPKDEISEFYMFPNPVRGGVAKARFNILANAKSATLELYDITGLCVYKKKMSDVLRGQNQFENLDLKSLGSDVYTARLKVKFESGKTKQKLYRVGIIR